MPFSITGAPACTFTPPGRKPSKARCAVMASALTPTTSLGRPGRCTSPAEIMVVTPPWRKLSIQLSCCCRGVQSPNTGCTWLSIRPGARVVPLASTMVAAPDWSRSLALPTAAILPPTATMVSASRIGRSRSPLSSRPMFLMTSFAAPPDFLASSVAMSLVPSCSLEGTLVQPPAPAKLRGFLRIGAQETECGR